MNHRTYDAQRYSPLDKINKSIVKSLKLAYAVALGDTSANEKCCLCLRYDDVSSIGVTLTPAGSREPACFSIRTG
jgi:glucose dehydrogenase